MDRGEHRERTDDHVCDSSGVRGIRHPGGAGTGEHELTASLLEDWKRREADWECHEAGVLEVLTEHAAPQPWWLGYLETGAHDVVFADAPRVRFYAEVGSEKLQLGWPVHHAQPGVRSLTGSKARRSDRGAAFVGRLCATASARTSNPLTLQTVAGVFRRIAVPPDRRIPDIELQRRKADEEEKPTSHSQTARSPITESAIIGKAYLLDISDHARFVCSRYPLRSARERSNDE